MKLAKELRCLVCQNETLADSRADLAEDLRSKIREQMRAGKSDQEIIAYLTDRYGKFILYNPPVDPTTYLLWFGPFRFIAGRLVCTLPLPETAARSNRRAAALSRGTRTRGSAAQNPPGQRNRMILFWLICAVMVAIALAFILPTLLQRDAAKDLQQTTKKPTSKSIVINLRSWNRSEPRTSLVPNSINRTGKKSNAGY